MKLLTSATKKRFNSVWSQDWQWYNAIIIAKFFTPFSSFTWYATEYNEETWEFFWLVDWWYEKELWYFTLSEFEELNNSGNWNVKVERDIYWNEKTIWEIM